MDKIFVLKLAFKNLLSRKLRTILTLAGIVIGISAIVFLISFGYGIERLVTSQITNEDAFKLIDVGTGSSKIVKLNQETYDKIAQVSGIDKVETITNLGGKAKKNNETKDIAVFAVSSPDYLNWSGKKIRLGESLSSGTDVNQNVVINTACAAFLGAKPDALVGQTITLDLLLPRELSAKSESQVFADQQYTIIGIIKDDSSPAVFAKLTTLAVASPDYFSQFKVKVKNQAEVEAIRRQIEAYGLKTEFVGDTVNQVNQFFNIFKIVLGSFGIIALAVALLGMFNTLTISLLERIKEVALMKILGMSKKDIQILFLVEAMTLGVLGGILGILWGIFLGKLANSILNVIALRSGGDPVSVFYYSPAFLLIVVIIALLTGLLTGLYPARRAQQVDPLDVLRYE